MDTDFRMFSSDYHGSLPGIDIAQVLDGAAYHSHHDTIERLRKGTIQVFIHPFHLLAAPLLCLPIEFPALQTMRICSLQNRKLLRSGTRRELNMQSSSAIALCIA